MAGKLSIENILAVLWDHDNTLLPTADLHYQKHKKTCAKYGIDIADKDKERIAACNGFQNWQWLKNERGLALEKDKYLKEIDLLYEKQIPDLELNLGIREALQWFKDRRIAQFILTNARKKSVESSVKAHNLEEFISQIWAKEDYQGSKTQAQTYLDILEQIKQSGHDICATSQIMFLDDNADCINAAKKAGCIAIQILTGPDTPCASHYTLKLNNAQELVNLLQN